MSLLRLEFRGYVWGTKTGMYWFLVRFSEFLYERHKLQLMLVPLDAEETLRAAL